jgi:phage-related protein
VREYLDGLPPEAKAKILRNLLLLSEFGSGLGRPFVESVGRNLWALRTVHGGNQYRVLFSVLPGRTLLMLHAFQKKTEKLPRRELETALGRLKRHQQKSAKEE